MTKIMTNKEIRRELDYGERTKFAKWLGMGLTGFDLRIKNKRPEMNLSFAYAKFREENPRDED